MAILAFYATIIVAWLAALPIAFVLFRRFADGGSAFAFPLGVVLASWIYFLGRCLSIIEAGRGGFILALFALAVAGGVVAARDRRFRSTISRQLAPVLLGLGLFTALFLGYVALRAQTSGVVHTEQPMDFMFLNAVLASPDYPPEDPWHAGEPASYYYFGYVQAGLLTAASGVEPAEGYNLALAALFASSGLAAASLAATLARWALRRRPAIPILAAGLTAMLLLLFVGSLAAPFEWAAAHEHYDRGLYSDAGVEWLLPCAGDQAEGCYRGGAERPSPRWYPTEFWWWFRDTRVIENTITEFPFFSFLLGDLHPHVMSLPVVLLALALLARTWRAGRAPDILQVTRDPGVVLVVGLVLGALAFTNAWDVITLAGALAVAAALRGYQRGGLRGLGLGALWMLPPLAIGVLVCAPWLATFSSQASGLFPHVGEGSRPGPSFLQFGVPGVFGALLLAGVARGIRAGAWLNSAVNAVWVPLLPLLAWLAWVLKDGNLDDAVQARTGGQWLTLTVYGLLCWGLSSVFLGRGPAARALAIPAGLAALAMLLLYGVELFFIRDVFAGFAPRLNTVFKLGYQAWILLAVAGGVAVALAFERSGLKRGLGFVAAPALLIGALGLVYPLLAVPSRLDENPGFASIDGLAFLERSNPREFALAGWVRTSTPPGALVLEGTGRTWVRGENGQPTIFPNGPAIDYGEPSRISGRTGRPTHIGWFGHELQWRGGSASTSLALGLRQDAVDAIYTGSDPAAILARLRTIDADYVVVGTVELSRYGATLANFAAFLDVAWESGDLRVYAVPRYEAVETS